MDKGMGIYRGNRWGEGVGGKGRAMGKTVAQL